MSTPSQAPAGTVKKTDAMSNLKLHLREVITEPTDLVKKGTAPPSFFFSLEPSGKDAETTQKFAAVLGASAVARIFAAMAIVSSGSGRSADGDGGEGQKSLSNPDEYVAAFNEKAEATLQAFTKGPLANMYQQPAGGTATTLHLQATIARLHDIVLDAVFAGLGHIDKEDMAMLGKVLASFMLSLKPFKVPAPTTANDTSQPDLKHVVAVNYVKSIDITGDGGIFIHKPFTRLVVFSVKPQHWASVLQTLARRPGGGKQPSADAPQAGAASASAASETPEVKSKWSLPGFGAKKPKPPPEDVKIDFTLNTTILELELDDAKYSSAKGKFEAIFKEMAEDDDALSAIAEADGLQGLGRKTCKVVRAVME
ncbi:hypothetical protein QBC47DRAFT_455932 [Echria macrotheca]|uniref:Uncharacterized protein n=1 Tax=Echria macrotheca TaxID=438768 RepID=A0AAJ0BLG4_9PEZI|nr:hypothetical protein QBC47DRAFT_455932 [Echria macrotheca]